MAKRGSKRAFGSIRKLPSGRYQARYLGPNGERITAPTTFTAKMDAEAWLIAERKHVESPDWQEPRARIEAARKAAEAAHRPTFAEYAETWLRNRRVKGKPLQQSTVRGYRVFLRRYLVPAFGDMPIDTITVDDVKTWHTSMDPAKPKTLRESYALGYSIMRTATAADGIMPGSVNPFNIEGAGSIGKRSEKRVEVVEDAELPIILATIRPEWQAMVLLALGCGLRFGELIALRRSDIDLRAKVIKVRRAIGTGAKGKRYEKSPKSAAGIRDQRIPAFVLPVLTRHLEAYVEGENGLLFPGPDGTTWLEPRRFAKVSGGWADVRAALDRPDLNFHDLRATGATRLARASANIAEVQAFLGDSTSTAAERYIRATQSRMDDLTEAAFGSLTLP